MTQAQHALIGTFLTQTCELVESAFIDEMRDHFVASVEARMANSLSFEEALQHSIDDFGGPTNIQKMEWTYRKVFFKKAVLGLVGTGKKSIRYAQTSSDPAGGRFGYVCQLVCWLDDRFYGPTRREDAMEFRSMAERYMGYHVDLVFASRCCSPI